MSPLYALNLSVKTFSCELNDTAVHDSEQHDSVEVRSCFVFKRKVVSKGVTEESDRHTDDHHCVAASLTTGQALRELDFKSLRIITIPEE